MRSVDVIFFCTRSQVTLDFLEVKYSRITFISCYILAA